MGTGIAVSTLEGYERWAPHYPQTPGNPLMRAEQRLMQTHWPEVAGRRALDLACGTGRYTRLLLEGRAAEVVSVDFSPSMLRQVSGDRRVRADMMRLPLIDHAFDVVISGLAIGHASDVRVWMAEVSRVLRTGGTLLYSDFHPAAARAGLPRTFTDESNQRYTVPHCCHDFDTQRAAMEAAGLTVTAVAEARVGIEMRESSPGAAEGFYQRWHGLPLVLVVRAARR
jgi:ubiquinone/menaquinone biosynthesis C-methylase UbiE